MLTKIQQYRWFEVYGKVTSDTTGLRIIGSVIDNTEEKKLQDLSNNYKLMLADSEKLIKIGSYEINILTGEQIWSKGFQEIFEVDDFYVPSLEKSNDFFYAEDKDLRYVAFNNAIEKAEPFDIELRIYYCQTK